MVRNVQIKTKGIKNVLNSFQISKAISEYIWNGFDANATRIEIQYEAKANGNLRSLIIKDNGQGIPFDELDNKFGPFHQSEKLERDVREKNHTIPHGYRGVGRLTFYHFSNNANWTTVFEKDGCRYKYSIGIGGSNLEQYDPEHLAVDDKPIETDENTGTVVEFSGFHVFRERDKSVCEEMLSYLQKEFGWFLELFEERGYQLLINGEPLNYSNIVGAREQLSIESDYSEHTFSVKYIRWHEMINKEYSYFYYLNSDGYECFKETTRLNNQGDGFYHSLYISSNYFDSFSYASLSNDASQTTLMEDRTSPIYKDLKAKLDKFLITKRRPFLKEHSKEVISELEEDVTVLQINEEDDPVEKLQKEELREVLKEMYEVEPKLFSRLNTEQKIVFVNLMGLILKSDERDKILDIISAIVDLSQEDREELSNILKTNQLDRIIKTIKMINKRYEIIEYLKELVFNKEIGANERDHLQKVIGSNYWIFGEKYALVSANETFEPALKNHLYILDGKNRQVEVEYDYIRDRPDIFITRQQIKDERIHNIIVELKHPQKRLGETEVSQIKKYMMRVKNDPRFNDPTSYWEFILVGTKFDASGFIGDELENAKSHGETGLIQKINNHSIFVKTWSQVISEFEIRHSFINEHLDVQKNKLIQEVQDADQIVDIITS